jgi:hypothetical protein
MAGISIIAAPRLGQQIVCILAIGRDRLGLPPRSDHLRGILVDRGGEVMEAVPPAPSFRPN